MYLGRIVECGTRDEVFANPHHPCTRALMGAVPIANPEIEADREMEVIKGEVPSVRNPPSGCPFHTRCPDAMPVCRERRPALVERNGHDVACHLYDPEASPFRSSSS